MNKQDYELISAIQGRLGAFWDDACGNGAGAWCINHDGMQYLFRIEMRNFGAVRPEYCIRFNVVCDNTWISDSALDVWQRLENHLTVSYGGK